MEWYKTLTIWQKINLKECSDLIVGMSFTDMGLFFSFKERIDMLYDKLQKEGFDI